ncbi:hypothetical protein AB4Y63_16415 [Leifsonia sp. YAF41]|uniref:hypothetical protein n=1 Tax=Leifsonia sp. YAF41 TaxID=3233086 RepID=UPI003F94AD54
MAITTGTKARRLAASALGIAVLSIGLVSVGGAAHAAPREHKVAEEKSCSLDLGTNRLVCVTVGDDLNKAVLEQENLIVVSPLGARGISADRAAAPAGALVTYVQAQLYADANYGGATFQVTNSAICNGSTTWYYGPLSNVGWSSKVSSFKSFSGCSTKLWQGGNYTGASYGYAVNAATLGVMNDAGNSVTMK